MASTMENALYSPYGAYELKKKYQINFGVSTLLVLAFVGAIVGTALIIQSMGDEVIIDASPVVIKTVAELGPPPTIAKKPPQVQVNQPNVAAPKVGIPTPVADDEVMDDDVMLATRDEMAEIVAPAITSENQGDIVVDISDDEYLPSIDEFVPVEQIAEMVYQEKPVYPRLAQQAGLEGTVWVKCLVTKGGDVRESVVYKSSGTPSLDEAAIPAAMKCKFRPAIQNGQPVAMWVVFKYDFVMPK